MILLLIQYEITKKLDVTIIIDKILYMFDSYDVIFIKYILSSYIRELDGLFQKLPFWEELVIS